MGAAEAVGYSGGKEISRDRLTTAGEPAEIVLHPEKTVMKADGHDLIYVGIEIRDRNGVRVPGVPVSLKAEVSGSTELAAFGSANPVTDENYTDSRTTTYRGRAAAALRSGYEAGPFRLRVSAEGLPDAETEGLSAVRSPDP